MDQKVAIITGGGSGIGRATAIELSARGYRLSLCGRHEAKLRETATLAGNGLAVPADVTIPDDVHRVVQITLREFGRIDAVINNAGLAPVLSVEETSVEQWHAVIDTNLSAAFYMAKAVWPTFRQQGSGVIVNISSIAARDPFPGLTAYAAAKAGLNLLSLSLARDGRTMGVGVYTIAPGAVETDMLRKIIPVELVPREKTMQPSDIAHVIGQCVEGDLKYTSGEVIWMSKE